jgi:uridine phosphorylase
MIWKVRSMTSRNSAEEEKVALTEAESNLAAVSIHLHPTAGLAERVLLPGDPGRALRLAQELIDGPLMFNHHRGLWGYTGPARLDGAPLTIQSTGMGGPSAAIVVSELIALGARRLLRVGTCGGLDPTLALGTVLVATEAIADDGTSAALTGGRARLAPSRALVDALTAASTVGADPAVGPAAPPPAGTAAGPVVSTDLFYDAEERHAGWRAAGALAVEMEAATLFALGARHGVQTGALLLLSDCLGTVDGHVRISDDALHAGESRLGAIALAALSGRGPADPADEPVGQLEGTGAPAAADPPGPEAG